MELYRISEFNETFTIQIRYIEKYYDYPFKPFPFFGKLKEREGELWKNVDVNGNPVIMVRYQASCPPFKTLDEARAQIKIWRRGTIYHKEK